MGLDGDDVISVAVFVCARRHVGRALPNVVDEKLELMFAERDINEGDVLVTVFVHGSL